MSNIALPPRCSPEAIDYRMMGSQTAKGSRLLIKAQYEAGMKD
jgi:hypothetical protein